MKGQSKLWLANGMKWRENSVLVFWNLLVILWNERNFWKSLRFSLVCLPSKTESYLYISNKITFAAIQISETFFWFMLVGFFCLLVLYFVYWRRCLVCFFGFFPSTYHSAVFLWFFTHLSTVLPGLESKYWTSMSSASFSNVVLRLRL